jgi:hypothetical protein
MNMIRVIWCLGYNFKLYVSQIIFNDSKYDSNNNNNNNNNLSPKHNFF